MITECVIVAGMALLPITSYDQGKPALLNIAHIESISSTSWRSNKTWVRAYNNSYASKLTIDELIEALTVCKTQLREYRKANQ